MKHLIKIESTAHGVLGVRHTGLDQQYCEAGELVILEWQPDAKWGLQEAHYTDGDDNVTPIDLTPVKVNGKDVVVFTMPNANITIGGTFKMFVSQDWTEGTNPSKGEVLTVGNNGEPTPISVDELANEIAEGDNNLVDSIDAINPFKGWYANLATLQASHPSPQVGDYAYVKGAESTDPAAIYECTTAGSWSDSGRTADTSNVQTFASSQEVNEVHIVNDLTTGGTEDVLSAEQGKMLANITTEIITSDNILNPSTLQVERDTVTNAIGDTVVRYKGIVNYDGVEGVDSSYLSKEWGYTDFIPFGNHNDITINYGARSSTIESGSIGRRTAILYDANGNFLEYKTLTSSVSQDITIKNGDRFTISKGSYNGTPYAYVRFNLGNPEGLPYHGYAVYYDLGVSGELPVYKPFQQQRIQKVIDSLESDDDNTPLSARQGKILNEKFLVDIQLPQEINVCEGDRMQLFWRNCVKIPNPYIYNIYGFCKKSDAESYVGLSYPRYFQLDAKSSMVGNTYVLTVEVNDGKKTLATGTTNIKIVAKATSPLAQKNIVVLGASTYANGTSGGVVHGYIGNELNRRLTALTGDGTPSNPTGLGLSNINFIGTVETDNGLMQEVRPGWGWKDFATTGRQSYYFYVDSSVHVYMGDVYSGNGTLMFTVDEVNVGNGYFSAIPSGSGTQPSSGTLTKVSGEGDGTITYTSFEQMSKNPFWNNGTNKLDFINYVENECELGSGSKIDYVVCGLGFNDLIAGKRSLETIIGYIKDFLDALIEDFSSVKVIIAPISLVSPFGGFTKDYGTRPNYSYWNNDLIIWNYNLALLDLIEEYSDNLVIAPSTYLFDSEHLYPSADYNVCNRNTSVKESLQTNGVHFTQQGAFTVADTIFNTLMAIM